MIQLSVVAEWRSDVWQALYTSVVTSVSAVPIGIGVARYFRSGSPLALVYATAMVIGLEVLQVAIETRSAQASDALWATVGAMAGVFSFSLWSKTAGMQRDTDYSSYSMLWYFVIVLGIVSYLSTALAPFDWIESKAELVERVRQLRSELGKGMMVGNDMTNASNLLRSLFLSLVLGALFGCTSMFTRDERNWAGITVLVLLLSSICVATELLQIFSARHSPSILTTSVRLVGGWLGFALGASIILRTTKSPVIE